MARTLTSLALALAPLLACNGDSDEETNDDEAADGADDGAASSEGPGGSETGRGTTSGDPSDSGGESTGEAGGSTSGGPSAGCGNDPGFTGAVEGGMEIDGETRRFVIVLPDDYDAERPYPLVFMLHGLGSNGEELRMYAGVEEAADGEAVFVYPNGLPQTTAGGATGWGFGAGGPDVEFIDALHRDFTENLCIDPDRIYATGHSHGGFMSNSLGCVRGDVFRAVAPVAGGSGGTGCVGQVAAWMAHNPADATVPIALGEVARGRWLEANGCGEETEPVDPDPCVSYVGCDAGHEVVWCEHDEDGPIVGPHTWPSFAGEAIWDFFVAH